MVAKSYVSKKPTSRKIKEKVKEYAPKAKSAFFAGLAFARAHLKETPKRKSKKTKRTKTRKTKKCRCRR